LNEIFNETEKTIKPALGLEPRTTLSIQKGKETAAFETKRSAEVLWHPKLLGHLSFAEENKISSTCSYQLQLAAVRGRDWSFYPCRFPSPLKNSFLGEARATFDLKKKEKEKCFPLNGSVKVARKE